jgi:hypothetical protein
MEANEAAALLSMYDNLRSAYVAQKQKLVQGSVFLGLMAMGSKNKRMRVLLDAAVPASALGSVANELTRRGLAERAAADGRLTLSSRGIWEAEQAKGVLDSDALLAYIDEKWFRCFDDIQAAVTDKEKLLLFVLLSARAFSSSTGVSLQNTKAFEAWTDTVVSASRFLIASGLTGDTGAEAVLRADGVRASLQPLVKFFRYSEYLPKKTEGIFVAKNLNYFLDLESDGRVERSKLSYLFGLVLADKVDLGMADRVHEYCRERAYELAAKVRPAGSPSFASSQLDQLVEAALRSLALMT